MKWLVSTIVCFCLLILLACSVSAQSNLSSAMISEEIQRAIPVPFGYIDNTQYGFQNYFSQFSFLEDGCIVVCADATNFNEFGVFYVKEHADVRKFEKILTSYLSGRKNEFCSGVIYDIKQYPKFENARVISIGNFVLYMILNDSDGDLAVSAVRRIIER